MEFEEYLRDEPLWEKGVDVVLRTRKATVSHLQRHLMIGYNRAARMIEMMEIRGILGPMRADGSRQILSSNTSADGAKGE
jgi:S-DNA-T family DNA segregation ATPase FtsK/SpoIIIE